MPEYKFWDLGEVEPVRPSKAAMASILLGLIRCSGRIHDTHSLELRDGDWLYPTTSCAVLLRISLPDGMESKFMELTGYKISAAPRVGAR